MYRRDDRRRKPWILRYRRDRWAGTCRRLARKDSRTHRTSRSRSYSTPLSRSQRCPPCPGDRGSRRYTLGGDAQFFFQPLFLLGNHIVSSGFVIGDHLIRALLSDEVRYRRKEHKANAGQQENDRDNDQHFLPHAMNPLLCEPSSFCVNGE